MTQAPAIVWTEKRVAVSALKPYEKNPRRISPAAREKLKKSILEMGYHQRALATIDLRLIGGHQRLDIFKELGFEDIVVLVPDRELTDQEFERALIQDNVSFGEFDLALLKPFSLDVLQDWGVSPIVLGPLAIKADAGAEWNGMPEFSHKDKTAFRTIPVHFKDQAAVDAFAKLIGQKITDDTRFAWYPEIEIETYADKKYEGTK